MSTLRIGILAIALAASACAFSRAPTLAVPLDMDWEGDFAVLVFDSTGLVTGGRQLELGAGPWPGGAAIARPEMSEIDIAWTGGACSHRPTVTVSGTSDALLIAVANPEDPNFLPFLPVGCPAIGLPAGITLSLSQPILPDAVDLEISY